MTTRRKTAVVTGSSGLVGAEAVSYFDARGWTVHGIDNNMRRSFFGRDGDTTANLEQLKATTRRYTHHDIDIRDRQRVTDLMRDARPDLVIHCAAQPSHDLARERPTDDFEVNALGTHYLLEAARAACPESPFLAMSTNKVYGDAPNELPLVELATRYDYAEPQHHHGIDESCRIDASLHSLFGASKVAADVLVQEYGRTFGMPTVCFRAGCLTGARHAGAELHGFLAYLARAVHDGRRYRINGYRAKQVRDNLHAADVCGAMAAFADNPRPAAVYNLGGARANSISVMEAIARFEDLIGRPLTTEYVDEPRSGDHICYISDVRRFQHDYPGWEITRSLDDILVELAKHIVAT
jgi:CDP-paratose 2-epimerase